MKMMESMSIEKMLVEQSHEKTGLVGLGALGVQAQSAGVSPQQGIGIGIGLGASMGIGQWPEPNKMPPFDSNHWPTGQKVFGPGGYFPSHGSPWDSSDSIIRQIERQHQEQERRRLEEEKRTYDLMKWQGQGRVDSAQEAKKRQSEQARGFAEGVELAQSAVGARHHLRQALSAGHAEGLRRCWGAILERGFQADALGVGKSETLMSAALGAAPDMALAFLSEIGFEPGAALATQAMLAAIAGASGVGGIERLMDDFGAGTLSGSVIVELERRKKGWGEKARARAEAYELSEETAPVKEAAAGPKRL